MRCTGSGRAKFAGSGPGGLVGPEVGKAEQVGSIAQVVKEGPGEGLWFEVDLRYRLSGERDGLETIFATGRVGELRAGAVIRSADQDRARAR